MEVSNPVEDCHKLALARGNTHFAVESEDECFTSSDAGNTYQKHGQSTKCDNGVGDHWAMDVYKIIPCSTGRTGNSKIYRNCTFQYH